MGQDSKLGASRSSSLRGICSLLEKYRRAVSLRRQALKQAEEQVETIFVHHESPAGSAGAPQEPNTPDTVVNDSSDSSASTSDNVKFNNALREYESLQKTALRLKEAVSFELCHHFVPRPTIFEGGLCARTLGLRA